MKKLGWLAFLIFFLLALPGQGHAAPGETHIKLDGREIKLAKGSQVQEISGNVLVPIRVVVEELGYSVNWDNKSKKVTIEQGSRVLNLTVDKRTAYVNGDKIVMSTPPIQKGNVTYVPLRFVSEQTGLKVLWDNKLKTAFLTTPDYQSGGGSGSNGGSGSGNESVNPGQVPVPGGSSGNGTTNGSNGNAAGGSIGETQPTQLSSINGISFSDNRLIVAMDGKAATKVSKLSNPDRLVLDIINAKFSDSFLSSQPLDKSNQGSLQVTDYPDVKQIRYSQFSNNPPTIRLVLDLNYTKDYQLLNAGDGLVIVDLNTNSSNPVTLPGGNGKKLVVIDAGHGGSDPGAISITGKNEKTLTLAVVLKVQELLKNVQGIDFVLTRSGDTYPSLSDRVKMANDLKADLFISVHGNSAVSSATGTETYYTKPDSVELANVMHKYLVEATGLPDRKVRQKSLKVTRETNMPAVLLEIGYLSNKNDEPLLYDDAFQDRVAEGIVAGIKEYLGQQ
ncbi:N-acetylmuramoyl-L-alanine amidase family protein [Paenibacillus sp. YPG26]|uniref:N-acetylmuramoyl-L-alanine amidase family protein n=1 Tax=Paenibacillus sp. YPG26 TaxID=2878915 RepID=UPI00203BA9FA|nr:N-acetylmuramoyl-L-alanine amidase family protein [Paenibacillus sp. YPG26]USB34826.1 N-acetylmuramoyl-L-alanine amidase family protein [Paenibacillus sp. YPG26]